MTNIITIPLTQGLFATIDESDFDLVSRYRWYARKCSDRYYAVATDHSNLKMHRLILGVTDPKIFVDHKKGNGLDNRRDNIRIATHSENMRNRKPTFGSTSKFKGVYWKKAPHNRWAVTINHKHIGYFHSEIEAAIAYNEKAKELYGEFAYLNDTSFANPSGLSQVPP